METRLTFIGDSIVAGSGDGECRGWVARVGAATVQAGVELTLYNLGIGGDTTAGVLARWHDEVSRRVSPDLDNRLVVHTGVNDARDGVQVDPADSARDLGAIVEGARGIGLEPLVVGPIPTPQPVESERIGALSERFGATCRELGAAFIEVHAGLRDSGAFLASQETDGYHPDADGYGQIARVVLHNGWWEWMATPGYRPPGRR